MKYIDKYCFCGKKLGKGTKSDICFICRRIFLLSLNKNLGLSVMLVK